MAGSKPTGDGAVRNSQMSGGSSDHIKGVILGAG